MSKLQVFVVVVSPSKACIQVPLPFPLPDQQLSLLCSQICFAVLPHFFPTTELGPWLFKCLFFFEKPSILKSWLFPSIRNVRSLLHEVKTDKKSWSMEWQVHGVFYLATNTNCTLWGFLCHLFCAIRMSPYFCCRFCGNLWKAHSFLKWFTPSHINTNFHKHKNSFDSSKDRLDTKILSQFCKLQDKNLSLILFYRLKTWT